MLYAESVGERLNCAETGNERVGITIGNLQAHTEQHREDKENRHLLLFEQCKGLQPHCLHKRLALHFAFGRTLGHSERIERKQDAQSATDDKLQTILLETAQIHNPHCSDKTDRTKHTDRWKILDRIKPSFTQCRECHRVIESQCRHIECHRDGIEGE